MKHHQMFLVVMLSNFHNVYHSFFQESNDTLELQGKFVSIIEEMLEEIPKRVFHIDLHSDLQLLKSFIDHPCGNHSSAMNLSASDTSETESVKVCLQGRLIKVRSQLFYLNGTGLLHPELKLLAIKLNDSTSSGLDKIESWLSSFLAGQRKKWLQDHKLAFKKLTVGNSSRILKKYFLKEMEIIKNASYILSKISIDYDKGRLTEASKVFIPSEAEVKDVDRALSRIQESIVLKRPGFNDFLAKECSLIKRPERSCSYFNCNEKKVKEKIEYLKLLYNKWRIEEEMEYVKIIRSLVFDYAGIRFISDCLRRAKSEAATNKCWVIREMGYIVQRVVSSKNQNIMAELMESRKNIGTLDHEWQTMKQKEFTCDCEEGEFRIIVSTGTEKEISCRECPVGMYNSARGTSLWILESKLDSYYLDRYENQIFKVHNFLLTFLVTWLVGLSTKNVHSATFCNSGSCRHRFESVNDFFRILVILVILVALKFRRKDVALFSSTCTCQNRIQYIQCIQYT